MKRFGIIFICIILASAFVACGSVIPQGMDKKTYEIGKNALEVAENYDKGLISKDEAYERINTMANRLEKLNLDDATAQRKNGVIQAVVKLLAIQIRFDSDYYDTIDDLKEYLGLK